MKNYSDEVELLKEISAFCEEQINSSGEIKTERWLERLVELGLLGENVEETQQDKINKSQYIKALMIYDELSLYENVFYAQNRDLNSYCRMLRATQKSFIPLSLLKSNMKTWGLYYTDDNNIIDLQKNISLCLEFANHVRNKISGHLENDVINNAIQWGPTLFHEACKNDRMLQKCQMYKYILESAINSYMDESTHQHKIFKEEIDLSVPHTCQVFYEYLNNLIINSIKYLSFVIEKINSPITYFHVIPLNLIKSAGETDFKTKNKGR